MYHVPISDTWDPASIAESLSRQGADVCMIGESVRVTLPTERKPRHLASKLLQSLFPPRPLYITISFHPENFIRNIHLEYDAFKMPLHFPCFDEIRRAIAERGYFVEADRKTAARYWPDSSELMCLFDELEHLQKRKLEFLDNQDFEHARVIMDHERLVRKQIDGMLFDRVGQRTDTRNRDEPLRQPESPSGSN